MPINKRGLFERAKALWPEMIDLEGMSRRGECADAEQVLVELYCKVEASIEESDHWMQIAIWAFHQAISESAIKENTKVYPRCVGFEDFDHMMIENLQGDDCWIDERREWAAAK